LAMTPFLVFLHFTGQETFELPSNMDDAAALLVNAAIMPFYDFSFALSLQLNPAILVGFATALVMPLSFVCDYFRHGMPIPWSGLVGAAIVVYGLILMDRAESEEEPSSSKIDDDAGSETEGEEAVTESSDGENADAEGDSCCLFVATPR